MSRINGIGTWLLGVEKTDQAGIYTATSWITALYLPLIPLARYKVKVQASRVNHLSYETLGKTELVSSEILKTYFYGWIVFPLLIFSPVIFAISEVQASLGVPKEWEALPQGFAVLWLLILVWKLKDWDENRWKK